MLRRSSYLLLPISLLGLMAFTWPLFIPESDFFLFQNENTKWLAAAILPIAILLFIFEINYGGLDAKSVGIFGPFGIPLEEYFFFLIVPIAAIMTIEAVRTVKKKWIVGDEA